LAETRVSGTAEFLENTPMIIGFRSNNYAYSRNIVGRVSGVEYKKIWDLFSVLHMPLAVMNRILKGNPSFFMDLSNKFNDFGINKVDLIHFFNVVSYGSTPWISTFETLLPRFVSVNRTSRHGSDPDYSVVQDNVSLRKALDAMAGDACKRLIALSACNAFMQLELLRNFPEHLPVIEAKLEVIHPPQPLLVSTFLEKGLDIEGPLEFLFVGRLFFRKGGGEVIETLMKMRREFNYDIKLTVVSTLDIDTYATGETAQDVARVQQLMNQNSHWITHHKKLSNRAVLTLMRESHVGLLPTYADTYGYSVLEFQSAGCPVITTNVRALNEINNDVRGWIIGVPKNRLGEGCYRTMEERGTVGSAIRRGIEQAVHSIFSDRTSIATKAEQSLKNIRDNHDPLKFSDKLRNLYLL
jgi:glycosyltransferase involved in cell wall biosynthesis